MQRDRVPMLYLIPYVSRKKIESRMSDRVTPVALERCMNLVYNSRLVDILFVYDYEPKY